MSLEETAVAIEPQLVEEAAVGDDEPAPVRIGKRVFVSNLAWRTSWQVGCFVCASFGWCLSLGAKGARRTLVRTRARALP